MARGPLQIQTLNHLIFFFTKIKLHYNQKGVLRGFNKQMFPLGPRDELVFGNTPEVSQPDKSIPDDLITADHHAFRRSIPNPQYCEIQFGIQDKKWDKKSDKNDIRRIVHRDLERQRRHEMAQLHASLRFLLPLPNIRGKRTVPDHLQEAVNYIKHIQNTIEQLKVRRDNLKFIGNSSSSGNYLPSCVAVNPDGNGLEILISSSSDHQFKISKVLRDLVRRDLNVFFCASNKANGTFVHKIQAEADDLRSLDISMLQERLKHLMN